jgi:DNA topoisomerase I
MASTRIVHVTDDEPGIRRLGRTQFRYVRDRGGAPVRDRRDLERIRALAIPPAWTDVWICADPAGHLQATGRDARGRKQYRYHPAFRSKRERRKFGDLVPFGHALGAVRRCVADDLRSPSLGRERVIAAVVSLLDLTYVRIGNDAYVRENRSYGLTTLHCKHVDLDGSRLRLRFPGKGGRQVDVTCCDARLARVIRRCQELPGQKLFQYIDDAGERCHVTSTDVNDYLRLACGVAEVDITAKTFRTWGGTLLAAQELAELEAPSGDRAASAAVNDALTSVASRLGNTVAVCRNSYVHPRIVGAFRDGTLQEVWAAGPRRAAGGLDASERKLLALLEKS